MMAFVYRYSVCFLFFRSFHTSFGQKVLVQFWVPAIEKIWWCWTFEFLFIENNGHFCALCPVICCWLRAEFQSIISPSFPKTLENEIEWKPQYANNYFVNLMLNSLFLLNFSIVGIPIVQHNLQSISFEQISCSIKMPAVFHFVLMGIHLFILEKKSSSRVYFILDCFHFVHVQFDAMQIGYCICCCFCWKFTIYPFCEWQLFWCRRKLSTVWLWWHNI